MTRKGRKRKPTNMNIVCSGNSYGSKCRLRASVRNCQVGIFITGSNEWAHLTEKQVRSLRDFLNESLREIKSRQIAMTNEIFAACYVRPTVEAK